ncbi:MULTISPECIES: AAA family ATPase [Enterobacteriaceae]|uniref:Protein CR006 P-loop domain-containing protein n=2 Tax=Enterobacteriaceae TaxID=543 RepID=A0A9X7Q630_9ENTR|nr:MULTISPECIES: AAA family ATPase [Enterobacteriaceae]MCU3020512.1 AAA family ATPase [Enterobacter hormaechei subsp. hoffmannii]HAT3944704.1 AAA family ATPase [Kluyvera ascorbata]HCJ7418366.1 AAA family ATPase [Enterobacter hormaechei subsp. xiangfangensis]MBZ7338411.1 AAA family ATPase [Klebsiella grimontii]MCU4008680.1 AAA family ATPase [Enterobacter hormaechei subsp. hoffmannii]
MLKKFDHIKKLGVFDNFIWDQQVLNKGGAVQSFVDINIIYGRNYSGKTTLSRIIRSLEKGNISDKYGTPSFNLKFADNVEVTNANIDTHDKKIRVFNEDFIRDNLRFISNPEESVESFAILGDDNNKIEVELAELNLELGMNDEGKETGLYASKKTATIDYNNASSKHKIASDNLDKQLTNKATGKDIGIKYKPERYGDQNYTIVKLKNEISEVNKSSYKPLSDEELDQYDKLIAERVLPNLPKFKIPDLNFKSFEEDAEKLITKKISASDKIDELVKDAILNRWVNEGRRHHRDKHDKCAFCDNTISSERWIKLDKHFDEESEQLDRDINLLIAKITNEKTTISNLLSVNKSLFYTKFHNELDDLILNLNAAYKNYELSLDSLIQQLNARQQDTLNSKDFVIPFDSTNELKNIWSQYLEICIKSDVFTNSLSTEQAKSRKFLRYNEVYNYLITIDYKNLSGSVTELKIKSDNSYNELARITRTIAQKQLLITEKKRELNDEAKGAQKVNEYLNNFFGHRFLSLETLKKQTDDTNRTQIRFEVMRDGKKAYHLSEGECSLLAFCYFLAKLDDIETRDSKPIIWIDDPISSLDGNHIFFIYSLLNAEVVSSGKFKQLFISTHNLDFLKYLKRLKDNFIDENNKKVSFQKAFFVVVRNDRESIIQVMPSYLKDYVTEFNYLFHQIYKCSSINFVDDTNYITFYNFANNARKFFEIYLYYKYPDQGMNESTLRLFFGEDKIPAILSDRINNEYSHLCGVFERGATPVEVPEMQTAARQIIERLKEDEDQYTALLNSVGEHVEAAM